MAAIVYAQTEKSTATVAISQRYVLFTGTYLSSTGAGAVSLQGVFKLDVSTGRTWEYVEGFDSQKKLVTRWAPISEP